jgi:hypothetical protein
MQEAPKKPKSPPTLVAIADNYRQLHRYALHTMTLAYAMFALAALLVFTRMPALQIAAVLPAVVGCLLVMLDRRWNRQARKARDANWRLPNKPLTDERDLQWIAWFCYIEPRAAKFLRERRPNGQYTARDFLALYVTKTADEIDAAFAPPYNGDSQARFQDLEIRRAEERGAIGSA